MTRKRDYYSLLLAYFLTLKVTAIIPPEESVDFHRTKR
jgi:hypothetical protein